MLLEQNDVDVYQRHAVYNIQYAMCFRRRRFGLQGITHFKLSTYRNLNPHCSISSIILSEVAFHSTPCFPCGAPMKPLAWINAVFLSIIYGWLCIPLKVPFQPSGIIYAAVVAPLLARVYRATCATWIARTAEPATTKLDVVNASRDTTVTIATNNRC